MHVRALFDWLRVEADRILGFSCLAGGGLSVFFAYWGLSDSTDPAQGMAHLSSGGVGGLFLIGLGATLLASADLRDSWRKLRLLERQAAGDQRFLPPLAASPPSQPVPAWARTAAAVGVGAGLAVLVYGWNRIATTGTAGEAYEGLAVAGTGLLATGLVAGSFIVAMRRAVERRTHSLLRPWAEAAASPPEPDQAHRPGGTVLVGENLSHYHVPGCLAVAGVPTRPVGAGDMPPGLTPCLLCVEG